MDALQDKLVNTLGLMSMLLAVAVLVALAFSFLLRRRGITTDPYYARVDRHGRPARGWTEAVDSLIHAGGGDLPVTGLATSPETAMHELQTSGVLDDAERQGFRINVVSAPQGTLTLRVQQAH